jgi:hypothetical protein
MDGEKRIHNTYFTVHIKYNIRGRGVMKEEVARERVRE